MFYSPAVTTTPAATSQINPIFKFMLDISQTIPNCWWFLIGLIVQSRIWLQYVCIFIRTKEISRWKEDEWWKTAEEKSVTRQNSPNKYELCLCNVSGSIAVNYSLINFGRILKAGLQYRHLTHLGIYHNYNLLDSDHSIRRNFIFKFPTEVPCKLCPSIIIEVWDRWGYPLPATNIYEPAICWLASLCNQNVNISFEKKWRTPTLYVKTYEQMALAIETQNAK